MIFFTFGSDPPLFRTGTKQFNSDNWQMMTVTMNLWILENANSSGNCYKIKMKWSVVYHFS